MKKTKLLKLLSVAIMLLCSLYASAYDFTVDDMFYNVVSSSDLTCEITYYSKNVFGEVVNSNYYTGSVSIPKTVTCDSDGNTYTVVGIGKQAFYNCTEMTDVTIATTVTYIDSLAFDNCSALTEITIPRYVNSIGGRAFYGCSALKEVEIPNGVDIIHTNTFYGCSNLTKVSIPSSVTSIWGSAFSDCSSLSELTIPSSVTSIGNQAFYNCSKLVTVTLEDGEETLAMTTSSSYTPFSNCSAINTLYLGRNLNYTGTYSPFKGKTALSSLTIGNKVTSISTYEFYECTALENVDLPNSMTEIGEYAFYDCSKLTYLTLGNNLCKIGAEAFSHCHGLIGELKIPDSVTEIGEYAFWECVGLTSLTLGNSVETIGDYAFYVCTGLTGELIIPNSITTIGVYVFSHCSKLTSLVLSNSVISIGSNAFSGCSSLIELTIPNSVNEIGSNAFSSCTALTKIIMLPITPPTIYDSTFDEDKEVEVPKESLTKYALASVWSDFDLIYSISEGDYYYPVPIIRVGDALVTAEGGDENGVALKNGETATIKLIEDGEINGLVLFLSEDITETLSSKGSYSFTVEKYHKNNTIYSYSYTYNLTVSQAGDVLNQITVANINSVYSLKIKGDINGTDILTIRKMPNLQILDISEANIVSGGDYYYNNSYATSDNLVGDYFFYKMDLLRYVKLPSNVKSIGEYAFGSCTSLTTIAIPNSVTSIGSSAFYQCSMLTDLTIGESVTSIGSYAFYQCSMLTDLTIPDKVISIEQDAFRDCTKLTEVIIPASVESIGVRAFMGCTKLTTLTLEDGISALSLGMYYEPILNGYYIYSTFDDCPLETIYMGRTVTYSSHYTVDGDILLFSPFQNMGTLTTLTISDSVERIPSYLFANCTGLTEITIPSSVIELYWTAFNGCSNLKSVTFEDGNRTLSISSYLSDVYTSPSFEYCESLYLGRNLSYSNSNWKNNDCYSPFALVTTLNSVTIGNSVTTVPDYLFYKCTGITSLAIGSQVTSMGSSAFYNCTGLTEVKTPNSINSIGDSAFYGCSKVTTLTIGSDCTSIGSNAFYNCSKLVAIYAKAVTPPEISSDTFKGVDKVACTLYVPIGSINPYWLHAYWSEFYNIVEMYFDDSDGIETVGITTEGKEIVGYYSIEGKQLNAPQHGINILRYSDGTTKKLYVK